MKYFAFFSISVSAMFFSTGMSAQCQGSATTAPWGLIVNCPTYDYVLVFHDEFDGAFPDSAKWNTKYINPAPADRTLWHSCIREHQVYLDENISVNNGLLTLTAKKENYTYTGISAGNITCNSGNTILWQEGETFTEIFQFTSGAITGKRAFQPTNHLWLEIRCKVPKGKGLWPAFWTWHHDEIDVFEYFNTDNNDHFTTDYHHSGGGHCPVSVTGQNLTNDFHTYAVEITNWFLKWYLDGELVRTVPKFYSIHGQPATVNCGQELPAAVYVRNTLFPDIGERWFAPYVNLAINQKFLAEEITGLPAVMEIDYVRIYQRLPYDSEDNLCFLKISGPTSICSGELITYTLNINQPVTDVVWTSSNNITIVNSDNEEVIVALNGYGNGWIKAEAPPLSEFCQQPFTLFTIQSGLNISGTIYSENGSQLLLTVNFVNSNNFNVVMNTPGVLNYFWELFNGNAFFTTSSNGSNASVSIPAGQSATFIITADAECRVQRTVTFVPTGGWFRFFPNPVFSELTIEAIEEFIISTIDDRGELVDFAINPEIDEIKIYDFSSGSFLLQQNFGEGTKQVNIDFSNFNTGYYLIEIYHDNMKLIEPILKI
jgi:beta-glucanase (GH16 family)